MKIKQFFAAFLALCLLLGMVPAPVLALDTQVIADGQDLDISIEGGSSVSYTFTPDEDGAT